MTHSKCIKIKVSKKDSNIHILVNKIPSISNIKVENLLSNIIVKAHKIDSINVIKANKIDNLNIKCERICYIEEKDLVNIYPRYLFLSNSNGFVDDITITTDSAWKAT